MAITRLHSSKSSTPPPPLPDTEDPFLLLGLDTKNPPTDPKAIKRAYRKRAMQYHPDVVCGPNSTEQERQSASTNFAKINAAYEMLTGRGENNSAGSASSTSSGSRGGSAYNTPPHRRPSSSYGSYSSSSGGRANRSTNWEDYLPNYAEEDAKYDTNGDSFSAIFSDLLSGVASGVGGVGGGGINIMGDLIDFLERNVDGFQSGYDDDSSLYQLLQYGSFDEIANEMDETDMLVTSLEKKLVGVEDELMAVQADLNAGSTLRFTEKLELQERLEELKAREKVVRGYLKKGRNRLIQLRERYKELVVQGRGGRGYGGGTGSTTSNTTDRTSGSSTDTRGPYSSPNTSQATSRSSSNSYSSKASSSSTAFSSNSPTTSPTVSSPSSSSSSSSSSYSPSSREESGSSWRNEGFTNSYGRRSSSSRRRRGSQSSQSSNTAQETTSTASTANGGNSRPYSNVGQSGNYSSSSSSSSASNNASNRGVGGTSRNTYTNTNERRASGNTRGNTNRSSTSTRPLRNTAGNQSYDPWTPPHRRLKSSAQQTAENKRRLRELQVDEDFENLKKEMGL